MNATLTYMNRQGNPLAIFKLTTTKTVVGRIPIETRHLSEVAEKIERREPYAVESEDTLFIGIPSEIRLSNSHFAISRSDKTGESTFWIEDLGSHCGFWLNKTLNDGKKKHRLTPGDRIHYGFRFDFNVD